MAYRISRNLEASIIQYLQTKLEEDGWNGVNVEKTFKRVYSTEVTVPIICVRLGNTDHEFVEIGTNSTMRNPLILVDIFASSDGQRLDLKDYLISILKHGCIYYEYVINGNGEIESKIANGKIKILGIDDTIVDLNIDKDALDPKDRYRHLISLNISLDKVEL